MSAFDADFSRRTATDRRSISAVVDGFFDRGSDHGGTSTGTQLAPEPAVQVAEQVHGLFGNSAFVDALGGADLDGISGVLAGEMASAIGGVAPGESALTSNTAMLRAMRRKAPDYDAQDPSLRHLQPSGGERLPAQHLQRMERAFDHDFSHVRVHVGSTAAQQSRALNAHAFTIGSHIWFGSGEWAPGTPGGDRLIAHELTHVIQHDQGRISPHGSDGLDVSSPSDPLELEAYGNENRILAELRTVEAPSVDVSADVEAPAPSGAVEAPSAGVATESAPEVESVSDTAPSAGEGVALRDKEPPTTQGQEKQDPNGTEELTPEKKKKIEELQKKQPELKEKDAEAKDKKEKTEKEQEGSESESEETTPQEEQPAAQQAPDSSLLRPEGEAPQAGEVRVLPENLPSGTATPVPSAAAVETDQLVDHYMNIHWDQSDLNAKVGEFNVYPDALATETDRWLPVETPPAVRAGANFLVGLGSGLLDAAFSAFAKSIPGLGIFAHLAYGIKDIWSDCSNYVKNGDTMGAVFVGIRNALDMVGGVAGNVADLCTAVGDTAHVLAPFTVGVSEAVGVPVTAIGEGATLVQAFCTGALAPLDLGLTIYNVIKANEAEAQGQMAKQAFFRDQAKGFAVKTIVSTLKVISALTSAASANVVPSGAPANFSDLLGQTATKFGESLGGLKGGDGFDTASNLIGTGQSPIEAFAKLSQGYTNTLAAMGLGDVMSRTPDGFMGAHYIARQNLSSASGEAGAILGAARTTTLGTFETAWGSLSAEDPLWTQEAVNKILHPESGANGLNLLNMALSPSEWIRIQFAGMRYLLTAAGDGGLSAVAGLADLADGALNGVAQPLIDNINAWITENKPGLDDWLKELNEKIQAQSISLQSVRDMLGKADEFGETIKGIMDEGSPVDEALNRGIDAIAGLRIDKDTLGIPSWIPERLYGWALDGVNSGIARMAGFARNMKNQLRASIDAKLEGMASWAQEKIAFLQESVAAGGSVETLLQEQLAQAQSVFAQATEAFTAWDGRIPLDFSGAGSWLRDVARAAQENQESAKQQRWTEYVQTVAQAYVEQWKARHADEVTQSYYPNVPQHEISAVQEVYTLLKARYDAILSDPTNPDYAAAQERLTQLTAAYNACMSFAGKQGKENIEGLWAAEDQLARLAGSPLPAAEATPTPEPAPAPGVAMRAKGGGSDAEIDTGSAKSNMDKSGPGKKGPGGAAVHDDKHAGKAAKDLNAKAFALGSDIYVDKGKVNPNTKQGQAILGEEANHVAQHKKGKTPGGGGGLKVSQPSDGLEGEAKKGGAAKQAFSSEVSKEAGGSMDGKSADGGLDQDKAAKEAQVNAKGAGGGGGGAGAMKSGGQRVNVPSAVVASAEQAAPEPPAIEGGSPDEYMANFVAATPSQKAYGTDELGAGMDEGAKKDSEEMNGKLPEYHAKMSGQDAPGTQTDVDSPTGKPALNDAPVGQDQEPEMAPTPAMPPTARQEKPWFSWGEETPEGDKAAAVAKSLGSVKTQAGDVPTSPGPAPEVPLTGESNPERIDNQLQSGVEDANVKLGEAQAAVLASPGQELVQPLDMDEPFQVPDVDALMVKATSTDPGQQEFIDFGMPGDVVSQFDADFQDVMASSLAEAHAEVDKATETKDKDQEKAFDDADKEAKKLVADSQREQEQAVKEQRQDIEDKRKETLAEQAQAVAEVGAKATAEQTKQQGEIQKRVSADQAKISGEFKKAESQAEKKVTDAEKDAEAKKKQAEKDAENKSWWEKACDFVSDCIKAVTDAITKIFDAVKSAVSAILDGVKALANTIIDAACSFIQGAIRMFGEFLKGLIDELLGDLFPGLAKALKDFVDKGVEWVNEKVQALADQLKEGIAALCDLVEGALNFIINAWNAAIDIALALVEAAITGDWTKLALKLLESALKLCGISPDEFYKLVGKGEDTIKMIVDDPGAFVGHCIDAVVMGFDQFSGNFLTHLTKGFVDWLTGQSGEAGITMPDSFDLAGVFDICLQVMGINKEKIREKAVQHLGEENVERIEFVYGWIDAALEGGMDGLWEHAQGYLDGLWDMVIGGIQDWLMETIVQKAVVKVASMFNPVGAIVQALMTAWDVYCWVKSQAQRIMGIVSAFVEGMSAIATGNIGPAANNVEGALAGLIPVAIDLLARLLGLDGIGKKVREQIEKVQAKVDEAIDKVIEKVKGLFKGGKGDKDSKDKKTEDQSEQAEGGEAKKEEEEAKKEGAVPELPPMTFNDETKASHRLWMVELSGTATLMVASENPGPVKEAVFKGGTFEHAPDSLIARASEAESAYWKAKGEKDETKQKALMEQAKSLMTQIRAELALTAGDISLQSASEKIGGGALAKYKQLTREASPKAAALVPGFIEACDKALQDNPEATPLVVMQEQVKKGDYILKGEAVPLDEIKKHGGLSRLVDVPSVYGYYLAKDAKADFKNQDHFVYAVNTGKFDPTGSLTGAIRGGMAEGWWFASDQAAGTTCAELKRELTVNSPAYDRGVVRLDFTPEDAFGDMKPVKPTVFDGMTQGDMKDPMWVASKNATWGMTRGGVLEAVAPPIDAGKASAKILVKGDPGKWEDTTTTDGGKIDGKGDKKGGGTGEAELTQEKKTHAEEMKGGAETITDKSTTSTVEGDASYKGGKVTGKGAATASGEKTATTTSETNGVKSETVKKSATEVKGTADATGKEVELGVSGKYEGGVTDSKSYKSGGTSVSTKDGTSYGVSGELGSKGGKPSGSASAHAGTEHELETKSEKNGVKTTTSDKSSSSIKGNVAHDGEKKTGDVEAKIGAEQSEKKEFKAGASDVTQKTSTTSGVEAKYGHDGEKSSASVSSELGHKASEQRKHKVGDVEVTDTDGTSAKLKSELGRDGETNSGKLSAEYGAESGQTRKFKQGDKDVTQSDEVSAKVTGQAGFKGDKTNASVGSEIGASTSETAKWKDGDTAHETSTKSGSKVSSELGTKDGKHHASVGSELSSSSSSKSTTEKDGVTTETESSRGGKVTSKAGVEGDKVKAGVGAEYETGSSETTKGEKDGHKFETSKTSGSKTTASLDQNGDKRSAAVGTELSSGEKNKHEVVGKDGKTLIYEDATDNKVSGNLAQKEGKTSGDVGASHSHSASLTQKSETNGVKTEQVDTHGHKIDASYAHDGEKSKASVGSEISSGSSTTNSYKKDGLSYEDKTSSGSKVTSNLGRDGDKTTAGVGAEHTGSSSSKVTYEQDGAKIVKTDEHGHKLAASTSSDGEKTKADLEAGLHAKSGETRTYAKDGITYEDSKSTGASVTGKAGQDGDKKSASVGSELSSSSSQKMTYEKDGVTLSDEKASNSKVTSDLGRKGDETSANVGFETGGSHTTSSKVDKDGVVYEKSDTTGHKLTGGLGQEGDKRTSNLGGELSSGSSESMQYKVGDKTVTDKSSSAATLGASHETGGEEGSKSTVKGSLSATQERIEKEKRGDTDVTTTASKGSNLSAETTGKTHKIEAGLTSGNSTEEVTDVNGTKTTHKKSTSTGLTGTASQDEKGEKDAVVTLGTKSVDDKSVVVKSADGKTTTTTGSKTETSDGASLSAKDGAGLTSTTKQSNNKSSETKLGEGHTLTEKSGDETTTKTGLTTKDGLSKSVEHKSVGSEKVEKLKIGDDLEETTTQTKDKLEAKAKGGVTTDKDGNLVAKGEAEASATLESGEYKLSLGKNGDDGELKAGYKVGEAKAEAKGEAKLGKDGLKVTGNAGASATLVGGNASIRVPVFGWSMFGEAVDVEITVGVSAAIVAEAKGNVAVNVSKGPSLNLGVEAGGKAFAGARAGIEAGAKLRWRRKDDYSDVIKTFASQIPGVGYLMEKVSPDTLKAVSETVIGKGAADLIAGKAGVEGSAGIGGEARFKLGLSGGKICVSGALKGTLGLGAGVSTSLELDAVNGIRFIGVLAMKGQMWLKDKIAEAGAWFSQAKEAVKAKIKAYASEKVDAAKQYVGEKKDQAKAWVGKKTEAVSSYVGQKTQAVSNYASQKKDQASKWASNKWNGVKSMFGGGDDKKPAPQAKKPTSAKSGESKKPWYKLW